MIRMNVNVKSFLPVVLALSIGFLLFEPWLVLLQMLLGVTVWGFMKGGGVRFLGVRELEGKEQVSGERELGVRGQVIFWGLVGVFLLTHLYPFWFGAHPLGYDTGIYRYEIWSSIQALPDYISGLFLGLPLITDVLGAFGFELDQVLYGSLLMASLAALFAFVMFLTSRFGVLAGVMGLFLSLISLVQWQAFEMVLLKQILAVAFVYASFWMIERRSYWFLPLVLFLALLQPLDALLVGLSVVGYALWNGVRVPESRAYYVWVLLIAVIFALLTLLIEPAFWFEAWGIFASGLFNPAQIEASLQQGVFLSLSDYGYQSAFLFVFGMLGWLYTLKRGDLSIVHVYFVFLMGWIVLRLFFFQRLLIQLDTVLILFSSIALLNFYRGFASDRFGKALFASLLVGLMLPFGYRLMQFQPAFGQQEFDEMTAFCEELQPETIVVATDSYTAPWLRGACLDLKMFGPGIFANQWSREDWEAFWEGDLQRVPALLEQYPEPLYFYVGSQQKAPAFAEALFEQVDLQWWKAR